MDLNLAAFLRQGAYTIKVQYQHTGSSAAHTYVSNLPGLAVDDYVLVQARDKSMGTLRFSVARIVEVHSSVQITPNSDIKYSWVIQKLDMTTFDTLTKENEAIESLYAKAYQENIRHGYANQILNSLSESDQASMKLLLGVST